MLMSATLAISVIVCTYNRDECIGDALASLAKQTLPYTDYEVLLVNNNSTDRTAEICEHFGGNVQGFQYRYFVETRQGLSYARNRGIDESRGEILVFMDDDAVAEPDYLQNLWQFFSKTPDAAACGGRIYPNFETNRPRWMSKYLVPLTSSIDWGDSVKLFTGRSYPIGANMAFKRSVFAQCGGFNTSLGRVGKNLAGAEEKDLFYRITEQGGKVYYVPDAVVHHYVPDSRLTFQFFKKQSLGIGQSERVRALSISKREYRSSVFRELAKWAASGILFFFYLISLRPAKAWRLLVFRWYVSKGLFANR